MTNQFQLFSSHTSCSKNLKIGIADSTLPSVVRKGTIFCSKNLTLKISPLCSESCIAKFSHSCCKFQDIHSKIMIGNAREVDEPYYFDEDSLESKQAQTASSSEVSSSDKNQIMLWHYRLGHPSFQWGKLSII